MRIYNDYYAPEEKNASQSHVEVKWAEIEFETDVNLTDKLELLALMYAAFHGHAEEVRELLAASDMLCGGGVDGCSFYVSDSVDNFSSLASIFLGWDVSANVKQVDITAY